MWEKDTYGDDKLVKKLLSNAKYLSLQQIESAEKNVL
jgi:hypothetical protein